MHRRIIDEHAIDFLALEHGKLGIAGNLMASMQWLAMLAAWRRHKRRSNNLDGTPNGCIGVQALVARSWLRHQILVFKVVVESGFSDKFRVRSTPKVVLPFPKQADMTFWVDKLALFV